MTDARERFLRVIAEHVPPERVLELHLFPPIRHGGKESGMAVVAATAPQPGPGALAEQEPIVQSETPGGDAEHGELAIEPRVESTEPRDVASVLADAEAAEAAIVEEAIAEESASAAQPATRRITIFRAHYRWTLKGPDRGKWEAEVVAEAEAPRHIVDPVVLGVHRRAGEDGEPERLTGDAFRSELAAASVPWSSVGR